MSKKIKGELNIILNELISPHTKQIARIAPKNSYAKRSSRRISLKLYRIYRNPLNFFELLELSYYMGDCAYFYEDLVCRELMFLASYKIRAFLYEYANELVDYNELKQFIGIEDDFTNYSK